MIDRDHPLPLYYQLTQDLRLRIERGQWKSGELIPPERELSATYKISRMTVRQALAELVREGLLCRYPGRGTFVTEPKIHKQLFRLTSFTEDMRARGKRASAQVLRLEMADADLEVASALEIQVGQPIALVERLRLADDEPVGIECAHFFFDGCETILMEDLTRSLYDLLSKRFGRIPTRANEEIEVGACNPREARFLGIRPQQPVMLIRRKTLEQHLRPFEYVASVYRADRYTFSAELMLEESLPTRQSSE